MSLPYTPLRIHSGYSFRESLIRLPELLERAQALGLTALAITDRDNTFGALPLAQLAARYGVRPIHGAVLTMADGHALTLLAEDASGHAHLNRLLSRRHLDGPPDWEAVAAHSGGLTALCGGEDGAVQAAIRQGDFEGAIRAARQLLGIFGDRAALEAPRPCPRTAAVATSAGLPVAAVAPVRYLDPADAEPYLIAQRGYQRFIPDLPDFHLPDPAAWDARWRPWPAAVEAATAIADRCRFQLPMDGPHLPRYPDAADPHAKLMALCEAGLARRYGDVPPAEARERLGYELGVIHAMGFDDYFLIQWDVVRHCREAGIAVGPGRGSGAGALVSYLLGLSDVCPLRHGLSFERFLNPGRRELPDIDLDLCWRRRDEAIAHIFRRYGEERVSRLATINHLGARAAVRLAGAGLGLDAPLVDKIAKACGHRALGHERHHAPALKALDWGREPYASLLTAASALEGLPDHVGMHPCGVVVTPGPLTDTLPLMRAADGTVIAQADKDAAEALGLLKMDLLGNRNMTLLGDAVAMVEATTGEKLDPTAIPLDDPAAFALLRSGRTLGVYQLESTGVQSLLRQFRPETLEDMTAITSLYRPGPISGGLKDRYVARRHRHETVTYPHPSLAPILAHTYGVALFQEQAMQVAVTFAGLSWAEADTLRRAITKNRPGEIAALRQRFVAGARARGHDDGAIHEVFDGMLIRYAGYGFVKAHAAASQVIAIRQAYVKARWPIAYLAAVLNTGMGYYPPRVYLEDARRFGAELAGPCVNRSAALFSVDGAVLRTGLRFVAELGTGAAKLVTARGDRPFAGFADVLARAPLPKDALANLIKSGACDGFGSSRPALLWVLGQHRASVAPPDQGQLFVATEPTPMAWGVADHDARTRRAHELEILGFPLTPVATPPVAGAIGLAEVEKLPAGAPVIVVAEIVYGRRVRTQDGAGFVEFLILSDGHTHVPAAVFPQAYERLHDRLAWSVPMRVLGRVDRPEGEAQLVVTDLRPLTLP